MKATVEKLVRTYLKGAITDNELFRRVREMDAAKDLPEDMKEEFVVWDKEHPVGPNFRTFSIFCDAGGRDTLLGHPILNELNPT